MVKKSRLVGPKYRLTGRTMSLSSAVPLFGAGGWAAGRAPWAGRGLAMEWSFLLDSLQAERDQGVTIDATRLPFVLHGRPYVIVDAPGHRQFLRNMITGAAGAAAAVLVVDAAEGVREQTRRHAMLLRLIGLRHVIVLLNKADLLDFDAARIAAASAAIGALLAQLDLVPLATIPASARHGDNIASRSARLPWYDGPTLIEALAAVPAPVAQTEHPLRMPVQDVYRLGETRVLVGRIERGRLAVGDTVAIGAQATRARVAAIEVWHAAPPQQAEAGQSVALRLEPEVVAERGDLLYPPDAPPQAASRLRARLFWLRAEPLRVGESFRLRLATAEYAVSVAAIAHVVDIDDLTERAGEEVPPEGFAEITLTAPEGVLFDPFEPGGSDGRGVLVDAYQRIVGAVPLLGAAALIPGERAIHPIDSAITPDERARARGHHGGVFWLTGLPGSGKSTLARAGEAMLFRQGIDTVVLDGDTLRARLNADLGFDEAGRAENVRRTAAVARLMAEAGLVVLVALISPRAAQRVLARQVVGEDFHEIHIDADLATCESRDPKGLYAAARAGRIQGFTGVDDLYEAPEAPDLRLDTAASDTTASLDALCAYIRRSVALAGAG
jgi:bifunctional enzyme CysN/CysC